MKVKLAAQIFSNSMARGIEFYREYAKIESLKNSYETQSFIDRFNKLFDALNRKHPAEGIQINNKDFEILEDNLKWLDNWEYQLNKQNISKDEFLTKSTADGLRVTIKSTIELSKYLLEECKFKYVLSAKFNQDRLEQFFGMARQVSGPNDHPCSTTFLQIYKTLSVYSILKPPKTGNCMILDDTTPKITINDLKTVFNDNTAERTSKLNSLKSKLDSLAVQKTDINTVFDEDIHNYYKADIKDCVIYYICGYITKSFSKSITCDRCRTAVIGKRCYSEKPEVALINLKSRGGLTHPNKFIFKILSNVENSFLKFSESIGVFDLTIDHFLENCDPIDFPCTHHKIEVLMFIISQYIIMRMRQYTHMINTNQIKKNANKKNVRNL